MKGITPGSRETHQVHLEYAKRVATVFAEDSVWIATFD